MSGLPEGKGSRICPVCGSTSCRFETFGIVPRKDALCIHCKALERHRLVWLFLQRKTDFFDGKPKQMLHVAPERCFESRFKEQIGAGYLTADLHRRSAMVEMDITDIQYPDQSFDIVFCSHVLEHVPDDRQAMSEFHRVLKESGWAILLVPIMSNKTFEDPSIIEPEERLKAFGQKDHVRKYGPDYIDRLREAGFAVEVARAGDLADGDEIVTMGLTRASGEVYCCTR